MPAPLSGSAGGWASTGISTPKTGRGDRGAEQRLVALVVGVRDQRDHARDQLGPGGLDVDRLAVGPVEGDPVVVAGVLARLELGLGDGGLEGDVPERRRLLEVGLAAGEVAQERALADRLRLRPDGRVVLLPVDREPERAPQVLEDLLVLLDEPLAQLDEVGPADRDLPLGVRLLGRREVGVVRAATGRSGRRSSSAPGARSAGRCRPSPSGRTPTCRASAGSARPGRCGCRRRRGRRAGSR